MIRTALPRLPGRMFARALATLAAAGFIVTAGTSCEGTKTAVGEGLLTSISGQNTVVDTIQISFTNPEAVEWSTHRVFAATANASALLIGKANNLVATSIIKFPRVTPWTITRFTEVDGVPQTDSLTITPYAVVADSTRQLRLAFRRFATDPAAMTIEGYRIPGDWQTADSATAALPPEWFASAPVFSGEELVTTINDTNQLASLTQIDLPADVLASIFTDSLSFAIRAENPQTMVQIESREGQLLPPYVLFYMRASVTSKLNPDAGPQDTVIARSYLAARDAFRFEHDPPGSEAVPAPNTMLLQQGVTWRGYLKFNRFDIPGVSDTSGAVPLTTTANRARLEFVVADRGNSFQPDSAYVRIYELAEPFDYDRARDADLTFVGDRLNQSGVGFNTVQNIGASSDTVRVFEIADLVNNWWIDPDENHGIIVNLAVVGSSVAEENIRVDAVEIVDARLIVTATLPPVLTGAKVARSETTEAE